MSVLRIRDVYPGSRIRIFFHPGTQFQDQQVPGFQIRIRNISILTQKSFLGFWKYDPIPDPDLDPQHWFLHGSKY